MNCREPTTYDWAYLEAAKVPHHWAADTRFYKGRGCDNCNGSGYKGRQGIYEVMAMTSDVRKAIMQQASTDDLRSMAISEGMLTLRMDGLKKVERGITTLEEVVKETAAI
jgi:type IV pilus assembly protein PilB